MEKILSTVDDTVFGESALHIIHIEQRTNIIISGEDDWNDVIIACSSLAAKWQKLSGFLGLSFKTIRAIKGNNPNDSDASWSEAVMQWILQDYNTEKYGFPSWKTLLKAVGEVDEPLFEKLAEKHKGMYAVRIS